MKQLIVGISGASGAPLAVELLKQLKVHPDWETHLVMSDGGKLTLTQETDISVEECCQLADVVYDNRSIGAAIASGSFRTEGMVIVPCSMKTVAGIASGYSDNLLLRAADVMLKERRKLVLVARESPLNAIHLRNLLEVTRAGAIVMPPMLAYYQKPQTVADMTGQVVGRILDQFEIPYDSLFRWKG